MRETEHIAYSMLAYGAYACHTRVKLALDRVKKNLELGRRGKADSRHGIPVELVAA